MNSATVTEYKSIEKKRPIRISQLIPFELGISIKPDRCSIVRRFAKFLMHL